MQTDSYFEIGHTHEVCEDYALTYNSGSIAYAIVCDGCSSADNVDLGARLLATAAKVTSLFYPDVDYRLFGSLTIRRAWESLIPLQDQWTSLMATLLMASCSSDKIRVRAYGDGFIALTKGDIRKIIKIEYPSGAPFYLAYQLDTSSKHLYETRFGRVVEVTTYQEDSRVVETKDIDDPLEFQFLTNEWDTISVISDGLNTFRNPAETYNLFLDYVPEFTGFKSCHGVFVKRRMQAFKKHCQKNQIIHDDDISIASICLNQ